MDQTISRIIALFYGLGIWENDRGENYIWKSTRRILYALYYVAFFLSIVYCALFSNDVGRRSFMWAIAIAILIITIKMLYLLWKKDEIVNFLYDPIVRHRELNKEEFVEVDGKLRKIEMFNRFYTLVLSLTDVLLILFALPFTGKKTLPLFIDFDLHTGYDAIDLIIYCVAFVFLAGALFLCITYNCLMLFIWYIMLNYSIEYKLLGNQLKRLYGRTYQQGLLDSIVAHKKMFR